jgi:hypothetical protein
MPALLPISDADVTATIARNLEIRTETRRLREAGNQRVAYADHPLNIEVVNNQLMLAAEFGRRHGWIRAKTSYSIEALAGRKPANGGRGQNTPLGNHHDLFDHHTSYREATTPFRAAGVSAHLYGYLPGTPEAIKYPKSAFSREKLANMHALAWQLGLELTWPTDFPSWWNPGSTTLVVYTPRLGKIE